ncbi:prolipoprotein diacylglyceryl transferase [Aliifodinibius sp. S!AR15-10]|uniref:prolipoprotein diacylglyceryl transferase n=1 Tax=Aliifodinibius sp. S!AR15-10 TaxID=2950437 RepID=UPI00285B46FC|nr:prolipoprotein diacylglyceryl transferase [Aliifodinibius sp. S!AR15-10]MDR8394596.1 prolipoprotein diacylglyceryl transferase [Aliifodinibius sp. S!AR15-10]
MQSTDHFVWDADPSVFNLGTVNLPFPVAIWGLVLAVVAIIYGFSKLEEQKPKGKEEPAGWKILAVIFGSLIGGQLLFLLLPSPTISQIGPIQPRWYGVLFASAFVVGYLLTRRMFMHANRDPQEVEQLLTYVLIGTVIGARLGHVFFYDASYYLRHPAEIIAIWHGGLASHGAAIGILLAMYYFVKKHRDMSYLWLADRVVMVVAIGGAFIRTGNFFNSEILGEPSSLPWAVIFARIDMIPRHPTMLYEAALCIATFAVLWVIYKRYKHQPPEGGIFGVFMLMLFTGRFLLEFTKMNQAGFASDWSINMGQWLSVPLIIAGIWLIRKVNWDKKINRSQ